MPLEVGEEQAKPRYLNTSLAKALSVLELFTEDRQSLSLTEIARELRLLPGSVYPVVFTLQKFGYLERDPLTKRYRLGMKVLDRANIILSSLDMRAIAKPVLKRLARELQANAHLAILYEDQVMYLDREEEAPASVLSSVIGRRVPAHCTALGKVLLAYQPEVAERVIAKGLTALTPNTLTDPNKLRAELADVARRGYAVDREEFHLGTVCVAAPVRNYRGHVVAALSVSLPKSRLETTLLESVSQAVVQGAQEVSQALGAPGPTAAK